MSCLKINAENQAERNESIEMLLGDGLEFARCGRQSWIISYASQKE